MPDLKPARCALCGLREINANALLCSDCGEEYGRSPEMKLPTGTNTEHIQTFVRRVRAETCKNCHCIIVRHNIRPAGKDCWGCEKYAPAYAPRETKKEYECSQCIHEKEGHLCQSRSDGIECEAGSQFVPRACGNCLSLVGCPRIQEGKKVCSDWQPRAAPAAINDLEKCRSCLKYYLPQNQGCKDCHGNAHYACNYLPCEQTIKCGFTPCPQPDCEKQSFQIRKTCLVCQIPVGEFSDIFCNSHYKQVKETFGTNYASEVFYYKVMKWAAEQRQLLARPAEPPQKKKVCDDCQKYNGGGHCNCTNYIRDDTHCTGYTKKTVEKSCSICGHFHAEPQYRGAFDGYCDVIIREDGAFYGLVKKDLTKTQETNTIFKGCQFTPRAAPQPERQCGVCNKFKKESHGGYDGTCLHTGCGVNEKGLSGAGCAHYHIKAAPACARCSGTTTEKQHCENWNNTGESAVVPICPKCGNEFETMEDGTINTYQQWRNKETAAGRPWACDKQDVHCEQCDHYVHATGYCSEFQTHTRDAKDKGNCGSFKSAAAPVAHTPLKGCGNLHWWFEDTTGIKPGSAVTIKGTVFDQFNPPYSPEELEWIKQKIGNGEWKVVTENIGEKKIMFKCAQCGYEDETRKKVKYCPACGTATEKEKLSVCDNCPHLDGNRCKKGDVTNCEAWMNDKTLMQAYNALKRENAALAQQMTELNNLLEYHKKRAQEFDHAAYLAQIECAKEQANSKQLSENVARVNSLNEDLEEKLQNLRRRGIPLKCKRCIKKDKKAGYEVGIEWPCQYWEARKDDMGYCCSYVPPAKPAALWKLKLRYNWAVHRRNVAQRKFNKENERKTYLGDIEYFQNERKELLKQLEGAA